MKPLLFIVLLTLCRGPVGAADFSWSLLGAPSGQLRAQSETASFDGATGSHTDGAPPDGASVPAGHGALVELNEPVVLSRVVLFTDQPDPTPLTTECIPWDDANSRWGGAIRVPDPTGIADDTTSTNTSTRTEWNVGGQTARALKILIHGRDARLTDMHIFAMTADGEERRLAPRAPVSIPARSEAKRPCSFGGGALANIGFWSHENRWIGNPNVLNRRDRVVFHFDVRDYVQAGTVEQAVLVLPLLPLGVLQGNWLVLECFKTERAPVSGMDIISSDVSPVATFLIDRQSTALRHFDVTPMLTSALRRGQGTITFRVRNVTVEKVGNRTNKPEGATIDTHHLRLEIVR